MSVYAGINPIVNATTVVRRPGPRPAAIAIARIKSGNPRKKSRTRLRILSTQPPRYPAVNPSEEPMIAAIRTGKLEMNRLQRVPATTRESMSRPNRSVPSGTSGLGGAKPGPALVSEGLRRKKGPTTATTTIRTTIAIPVAATGFDRASLAPRFHIDALRSVAAMSAIAHLLDRSASRQRQGPPASRRSVSPQFPGERSGRIAGSRH
jgi:hypothetical protein